MKIHPRFPQSLNNMSVGWGCPLSVGSNHIVSGDKHLLELSQWRDLSSVTPARFVTGIVGRSDPP